MKRSLIGFTLVLGMFFFTLASSVQATTLSWDATVDNEFWIFISTDPSAPGSAVEYGNDWLTTYSDTIALPPGNTLYLLVRGHDQGGPAGFIGDFTLSDAGFHFENGSQHITTNTDNWVVSPTSFVGTLAAATSYGNNLINPHWGGPRANIDNDALWIWTSDHNGDDYAYFVTSIIPSAVPLPGAVVLLASGLAGFLGLRRRLK